MRKTMRFRYAFQKIVDLKSNEKSQAEWLLSEAIGKVREQESTLSELFSAKDGLQEQLHTVSSNKATISQIMMLHQFVDHIDTQIVMKNRDLQQAQQIMMSKKDELVDKMVEEKIWSKAKDKAHQRFAAATLKKEQDSLDEMTTNRFKRLS
jgi:flagellar FliJ protein